MNAASIRHSGRASLALLLATLIWGGTFVSVKLALTDATPLLFVAVRFAIGAVGALVLFRRDPAAKRAFLVGLPIGVVLCAGYASQTIGLQTTTPARSAFITALSIVLVPFWAACISRARPRRWQVIGLLLAVPGLWLVTAPADGFDHASFVSAWSPGDSWTVACAICFGLHVALISHYAGQLPIGSFLISQLATTSALAFLASSLLETPRIAWTGSVLFALFLTGILATTFTTWIQLRYQPRVSAARVAVILAMEPVFGTLFSWVFYGERLSVAGWCGGGLILLGLCLSEWAPGMKPDQA